MGGLSDWMRLKRNPKKYEYQRQRGNQQNP